MDELMYRFSFLEHGRAPVTGLGILLNPDSLAICQGLSHLGRGRTVQHTEYDCRQEVG